MCVLLDYLYNIRATELRGCQVSWAELQAVVSHHVDAGNQGID